jgi:hypothetical protein
MRPFSTRDTKRCSSVIRRDHEPDSSPFYGTGLPHPMILPGLPPS